MEHVAPNGADVHTDRPFLDFYQSLDISPVKQDIANIDRHYQRRDSLYRFLGIPPFALRGARVIEFGPGSGSNAIYTASLRPLSYTLVDGNPRGIADMRQLFAKHQLHEGIEIVEGLIEEFEAKPEYDLVLAEGLIPFQLDPSAFARHIAAFAKPGGIVVLTCSDAVSIFAEVGRRLIAQRSAPPDLGLSKRMDVLRSLFSSHLATLEGMSRTSDDWILDNIIQPFSGRTLFSISEAIVCLKPSFDVYGSSPRFLTDWRWYKEVSGSQREFNARAVREYEQSLLNLLDYRFTHKSHSAAFGLALLTTCQACYELMQQGEIGENIWEEVLERLRQVALLVSPFQSQTAGSIESLRNFLSCPQRTAGLLDSFVPFFGRGMQYLSFIRR